MAVQYAGDAAIRIVPSLRNFRSRVQNELSRKPLKFDIDIRPKVDTSLAEAQLEKFRAKERADAINLKARVDISEARAAFSQVEHIFKRSAVAKAIRLNLVVLGGDAVYAAVGALGSLSAAADVAGKSLVALPGAFASAGTAAGVFAVSLLGIKDAFKALADDQDDAAQSTRELSNAQRDSQKANRDVERAIKNVADAYRDARRDVEDLHREVRRGSLTEAEAVLNLQESLDTLRAGGFKNMVDFRRSQLGVLRAWDDLQETQIANRRNLEDYNRAQAEGISQNDRVVQALDAVEDAQNRVADAADRMAKANTSKGQTALAKLAPEAQEFMRTVRDASGVWQTFVRELQGNVFRGQSTNFLDTLNVSMKNLGPGLRATASQINGVIKEIGATLRDPKNQNSLQGIIGNTNTGLATLRKGIDPLVSGLLRISDSAAFPTLAGWLVKVTERWDAWTQRIKDSGELDEWIRNGVAGLDSLLNTAVNLGSFVASVADAWRAAGGEQAGVIDSAEKLSEKLANWASSAGGKNTMIQYFREVRDFVGQVIDALKDMGPLVSHISDFVRDWSAALLTVVGNAAKLTVWVEEHTGAIKYLLWTYLSFRTIAPIWQALSTGAANYTKVVKGLGDSNVPVFRDMNAGLAQTKSMWSSLNGVQAGAAEKFTATAGAANKLNDATKNLFAPTNNLSGAFREAAGQTTFFANQAGFATTKVGGGAGGVAAGLRGALGGLAAFLGPTAVFAVAMAAGVWAVNKLGEAHRNAARDAQAQKNALDALKGSLDAVTGAATQATAVETAKQAQAYSIPNFPGASQRNVLQDIVRSGVGTPQELISATNPTQTPQREMLLQRLDNATEQKILQSEEWRRAGKRWQEFGIDSHTLAQAANGDQAAVAKVNQAEKDMMNGHTGDRVWQSLQRANGNLTPSLADVIGGAGTFDTSSSAIFLRDVSSSQSQAGAATQAANTAAAGNVGFKPGMSLGGPGARVYTDGATTKVETSGSVPEGWAQGVPSEIGQAVRLQDGRGQITLTPEAVAKYTQGFASGGLIHGTGSGTSDSNVVRASLGEYIIKKSSVDKYGVKNLNALNSGVMPKFDGGGPFIGPLPPPTPVTATQYDPHFNPAFRAPSRFDGVQNYPALQNKSPEQLRSELIARAPSLLPPGASSTSTAAEADSARPMTGNEFYRQRYAEYFNKPPVAPPTPPVAPKPLAVPPAPNKPAAVPAAPASVPHGGTGVAPGPATHLTGSTPGPSNFTPSVYTSPNGYAPQTGYQAPGMTLPGVPSMPGRFANVEHGLQRNTVRSLRALSQAFPQITDIGGVRADRLKWHPEGLALDVMIPGQGGLNDPTTPEGKALGDQIWAWAQQNADALGIDMGASLWQQKDHYNHIHLATTGGGYPDPGEVLDIPGMPQGLLSNVDPNLLGQLTGQQPDDSKDPFSKFLGTSLLGPERQVVGPDGKIDFGAWLHNKYVEAYKPENIFNFLGQQANNIGSSLKGIGLQALQGFTGVDLSGVLGAGESVANHFLGDDSGSSDSSSMTEGDPLDSIVSGDLSAYLNNGTSMGTQSLPSGGSPKDVVRRLMLEMGWPDSEWPALEKLVEKESSWRSDAVNPSSGAFGLFQFLGHENDQYGKLGGYSKNVSDQARAGLQYIADRYGTPSAALDFHNSNNWYANGGKTVGGPIRVSRGEFRMNPNAVKKHGAGFMAALNAGSLPKFEGGGLPFLPQPVPPPNPAPAPAPGARQNGPEGTQHGPQVPGAPAPAPGPEAPQNLPGGPQGLPAPVLGPDGKPLSPEQQAMADALARGLGNVGASQGNMGTGYLNPGITGAIEGGFNVAGTLASTAAQVAMATSTMGGSAAAGPASGAASSAISAGFQLAGKVASGAAQILGAAGIGSIDQIGTQATPSGTPLLPVRQPQQFGQLPGGVQPQAPQGQGPVQQQPLIINNYNGGIHTQNLDDWQRRQQRLLDQQAQPAISKYSI